MKASRTKLISIALVLLSLVLPMASLAAGFNDGFTDVESFRSNRSGVADLGSDPKRLILNILGAITALVSVIALAAIVYAGFLLITDRGNEDNVEKAKKIILYAVVGLILIGLAAIIVNAIINIRVINTTTP